MLAAAIELHLKVNLEEVQSRRSTRWSQRNESARLYHHWSRKVLPPLKTQLRT
jgi:hypothetical protein